MSEIPNLLSVHGALSTLVYAVSETLKPMMVDVSARWRSGTYLSVEIECRERNKQKVIDRLSHGALIGNYDYRFRLSYSTSPADPDEWVIVTAYPDMHHDVRIKKAKPA